jgi:hypothetical protein
MKHGTNALHVAFIFLFSFSMAQGETTFTFTSEVQQFDRVGWRRSMKAH